MSANNRVFEGWFPALLMFVTGLFLVLLLLCPGSSAETRAEYSVVVEEDYEIRFPTFTSINVTGEYDFLSIIYDEDELSAKQLQQLYQNGSEEDQDNIKAFLEGKVEGYLYDVLGTTFEKTNVDPVINFSVDKNSLENANYSGPVRLQGWGQAVLTAENFGLGENLSQDKINDIVQGVFTMGAVPELDIRFNTPGGHSRAVKVFPALGTGFLKESFGYDVGHPAYLSWEDDNTTGDKTEKTGTVYLKSTNPNPALEERIDVDIVVDWTKFDSTQIKVVLKAYSLDIGKYSNLSDKIHGLEYIPASGVRMALDEELGAWNVEELKNEAAENATREIEEILSDSLEQDIPIQLSFDWNESTLSGYNPNEMSSSPPLQAELVSAPVVPSLYKIQDIFDVEDMDVVRGFLNAGARADFDIDGMDFGQEYRPTITLVLPENMRFRDTDATESLVEGRYRYNWDPAMGISGKVVSTTAPDYTSNKVELDGVLDFKKFKVDLFAIDESTLSTDFSGELRFNQFELTDVIANLLPVEVDIDYVNADIIRLVYDKDLVDLDEITDMLQTETRTYEEKLSKAMGEEIHIKIKIDESSLKGYDLDNMKNTPAIRIHGGTSVEIPVAGGASGMDMGGSGASFELKRVDFDFEVPYLTGWAVNLQVIFPKGIEIVDVSDDNNNVARTTVDGRDAVTVTIEGKKNHVYFTIAITPIIIYETCQIPIFATIGLIVFYVYMKRRRKAKAARVEEEEMLKDSQGALLQDSIVGIQGPPGTVPPPGMGSPMGGPPPGQLPSLGQPPAGQQPPTRELPSLGRGLPPLGGFGLPPLSPPDGKKKK